MRPHNGTNHRRDQGFPLWPPGRSAFDRETLEQLLAEKAQRAFDHEFYQQIAILSRELAEARYEIATRDREAALVRAPSLSNCRGYDFGFADFGGFADFAAEVFFGFT